MKETDYDTWDKFDNDFWLSAHEDMKFISREVGKYKSIESIGLDYIQEREVRDDD